MKNSPEGVFSQSSEPRLILDVMGGDNAPHAQLQGAQESLSELTGELVLLGDESLIRKELEDKSYQGLARAVARGQVQIVHAPENIEMGDSIRAIRGKPNATVNVGCKLAAQDWNDFKAGIRKVPSAFVSAGHSGAVMASALLGMGRLGGIERPAIAVKLPTMGSYGCVFLDSGANIDCKPEHLRDFALMGALFAQVDRAGHGLPKVAVLSNGEELSKGTELTRASVALIQSHPAFNPALSTPGSGSLQMGEFVGYAEGKELFKGTIDVVVTDGFTGNVVLKSLEGLGLTMVGFLKTELKRTPWTIAGALLSFGVFRRLKRKLDYAEYGAAPLLGVSGYVFICHGRSNPRAIKNSLLRAQSALRDNFLSRLESSLALSFEGQSQAARPAQTSKET